ncbi:hypothetical protein AVEN_114911-1 [Araneus ventricosus]|uniref:Uncharacterized protein n=1 Tax=Araneus ventricosus TaxID=182803 RepID=A0A4Y2VM13_ARAVE|nr:hypothetical protein AVEN_114911-1 [Araneus ventricosus]
MKRKKGRWGEPPKERVSHSFKCSTSPSLPFPHLLIFLIPGIFFPTPQVSNWVIKEPRADLISRQVADAVGRVNAVFLSTRKDLIEKKGEKTHLDFWVGGRL